MANQLAKVGIEMEISGSVDRVAGTLEDAKQYCLVLNSLRVPVVIETQIQTTDGAPIELPCATGVVDDLQSLAS